MAEENLLRPLPTVEDLIQTGSRAQDIRDIDQQFYYDPSGVDPGYVRNIYDYYMGGYGQPGTAGDIAAETATGTATPSVIAPETGSQDQGTGPIVDTTLQDSGAVDVPGTIGTLGGLADDRTVNVIPVNPIDEFGIDGNVYADVTPTTVDVPGLDLSQDSQQLREQGLIETPSEFYERNYNASPGDYDLLDQEEKNIVDQEYGIAYGLSPAIEPAPTLRDVPLPAVQLAFAAKDAYDKATEPSLSETIDFNTYADPVVDAEENQPTNIQNVVQTTPPDAVTRGLPAADVPGIESYADPDEITEGLTYDTTPLETATGVQDSIKGDPFYVDGEFQTFTQPTHYDLSKYPYEGVTQTGYEIIGYTSEGQPIRDFRGNVQSDSGVVLRYENPRTIQDQVYADTTVAQEPIDEPSWTGEGDSGYTGETTSEPDFSGYDAGGYDPAPAPIDDPTDRGGDSGGGGGGKIVCTMMNETYGFGSFRNKIWLRQSKDLAPEYQKGYHILFLPLVRLSKKNKLLKKTLEHIAVHRTIDIRQEARGKRHLLGRIYRKILEPICYWVGKYAKR